MRRMLLPALMVMLLLGLYPMAAQGAEALTASEVQSIQTLLGEVPDTEVRAVSAGSTVSDMISWLRAEADAVAVDDRIAAWLRIMESVSETLDTDEAADRLTDLAVRIDDQVLRPMEYLRRRLRHARSRLNTLTEELAGDMSGVSELERTAMTQEVRFLKQQLQNDMAEALALAESKDRIIAEAEAELQSLETGGVIPDMLEAHFSREAAARRNSIREAEQAQLDLMLPGQNGAPAETGQSASVFVIDGNSFAICLTKGSDPDDFINDAAVTVSQGSKSSTVRQGDHGCYVFQVSQFSFPNSSATLQIEVKANGYREVFYREATIDAGSGLTIPMTADDGSVYLKEASFDGNDMLHDATNGVFYLPDNKGRHSLHFQMMNLTANASGTLSLTVDKTRLAIGTFTADPAGKAELSASGPYLGQLKVDKSGNTCPLTAVLEIGAATIQLPLQFTVSRSYFLEIPKLTGSLPSLSPGKISVKLPSFKPVLTNPSADIGSPLIPNVSVLVDLDGTVALSVGIDQDTKPKTNSDGSTRRDKDKSWNDMKWDFDNKVSEIRRGMTRDGEKATWPTMGSQWKVDWNVCAGLSGKCQYLSQYELLHNIPLRGTLWSGASVSFIYSYNQQYLITAGPVPVPVYVGFDVSFTLGLGLENSVTAIWDKDQRKIADYSLKPYTEFTVTVPKFTVGVSAGLGIKGIISGGLRGYVFFTSAFHFIPEGQSKNGQIYVSIGVGGGLDVEFKAVIINVTVHVLSVSKTWPETLLKSEGSPAPAEDAGSPSPQLQSRAAAALTARPGAAAQLTALPSGDEDMTTLRAAARLSSGESEDIRPEKEIRYDGVFDRTNLKSLTVDPGNGRTVNLVFFSGNSSMTNAGYESIQYAVSEEDRLVIRGAAYTADGGADLFSGGEKQPWGVTYLGDFDVCWDSATHTVYLLTVFGYARKTEQDMWEIYGESLYAAAYQLSADGKKLNRQQEWNLVPMSEAGHSERVWFSNPRIAVDPNHHGAACAAVGRDLADTDTQGIPLAHPVGSYPYVGFFGETSALWRYNDLRLGAEEEPMQIAFTPGYGSTKSGWLYELSICLLTGVAAEQAGEGEDQNPYFESNRLHYLNVNVVEGQEQFGYLPNRETVRPERSLILTTIAPVHIANIMPGLVDGQILAVRRMEETETDSGEMETTLSAYRFQWLSKQYERTDYGFTTAMNRFGTVFIAGAHYLYWLQTYQPMDPDNADANAPDAGDARYIVRCCLYDPVNQCFTRPFDLIELANDPRTIALADGTAGSGENAAGIYTTPAEAGSAEAVPWSFVSLEYRLKTCLDFLQLDTTSACAQAGKPANLGLSVRNTGNTLIASFDVTLTGDDGTKLGTISIDAVHPADCSVALYDADGGKAWEGGALAVYRVPGDMASTGERLVIRTRDAGSDTVREVASLGILPDVTANYLISVQIPSSWSGTRTIHAEITNLKTPETDGGRLFVSQADTADTDLLAFSDREAAAAAAQAVTGLRNVPNSSSRHRGTVIWDHDDLSLNLRLLGFADGMYVEARIMNRADESADGLYDSCDPPVLTFSAADGGGNETETFRHAFARSIHAQNGYSLLIPLDLVDGNGEYEELIGRVTGSGNGYLESGYYNNTASIPNPRYSEPPMILSGPDDATVCENTAASFTVTATGDGLNYQWYEKIDGIWKPLENANRATWTTPAVTMDWDGRQYRCTVTDSRGRELTSRTATLHVFRVPLTGDPARPGLWISLILAGAFCMAMLLRRKRCHKYRK